MTIAIAVRKNAKIALASDSQTSVGEMRVPAADNSSPKFIPIGKAYIADAGIALYSNILPEVIARHRKIPSLDSEANVFKFFSGFWKELQNYHYIKPQPDGHNSPFANLYNDFLVVSPQGIFRVAPDLTVLRYERYCAIGSGEHLALGAAHILYESQADAEEIARRAVEAAIEHDTGCGAPIHEVEIRQDSPSGEKAARSVKRRPALKRSEKSRIEKGPIEKGDTEKKTGAKSRPGKSSSQIKG
ncbi:hypothetical protein [Thioalkalivibrio sp. HK1]|uniref:hypothetical protein n=1 Tax=Thioalkalivibrio sp. HK1 TaxID=1469245 RepID=UPI0012DFBC7B|nr:hypothetical protein [Thioalkalivibrio sp. HK1]